MRPSKLIGPGVGLSFLGIVFLALFSPPTTRLHEKEPSWSSRRELQAQGPLVEELRSARIIPGVIEGVNTTSGITMAAANGDMQLQNGLLVPRLQAENMPNITIEGAGDALLTLVMVDPDATRPGFLHWLVNNIRDGDVEAAEQTTPYRGPNPPSGQHRYVLALFRQPSSAPAQMPDPSKGQVAGRAGFRLKTYAALHNLGSPVAVLYYVSSPSP